jgi:solute carrier family 25 citrate transporter 1
MSKKEAAPKLTAFQNAICGGITGAMEISITFPTEYTKTVMQLYPEENKKGAIRVVKDTINQRGFFGLYKGYSALLAFSVPKNYVRFGTYTYIRDNHMGEPTKLKNFMCGLCAGAAEAIFVVTPQETLKTKLIHDKLSETPKYRNLFHGIYRIASDAGFAGVYRGPLATVLKQSTN